MSKTKPPKLALLATDDKKECIELWLEQFDDWCNLQGWRDTTKPMTDDKHWKAANHAEELSAFRLALSLDMLRMVKSTLVPTMQDTNDKADGYIKFPFTWERKLLKHYSSEDTVLAERMTFMETCRQKDKESIADFEARCKYHGLKCEYNKMTDVQQELIRDRFVTGIHDDKLRAELLHHKKDDGSVVTLTEVINKAKAWEAANKINTQVIESHHTEEQVNYTTKFQRGPGKSQTTGDAGKMSYQSNRVPFCNYCGANEFHVRKTCPAGRPGVMCKNCFGTNHFAAVCRSQKDRYKNAWLAQKSRERGTHVDIGHKKQFERKSVHSVDQRSSDEDVGAYHQYAVNNCEYTLSLDEVCTPVHAVDSAAHKLYTELPLSVNGDSFTKVKFQVDTAASCNTMPYELFLKVGSHNDLCPSKSTLLSYSGDTIKPLGRVTLLYESSDKYETLQFEVIDSKGLENRPALLGVNDSIKLKLIQFDKDRTYISTHAKAKSDSVSVIQACTGSAGTTVSHASGYLPLTEDDLRHRYCDNFKGLGKLGTHVHFEMNPSVTPVHAPVHRIPVSKREKVKQKLDEMVSSEKLCKVDIPTDWCSNMTVVEKLKPNNVTKLRICLDPSQSINRAIIVPKYTIPVLQEILPSLSAKKHKCFTIMDALDGFTQVPLDEVSSMTTVMHTPWGRYRWLRLPYGVSSAPEEFQKRIHEALEGLSGLANIADDIMVYGLGDTFEEAEENHDKHVVALMERCQKVGLKLNPSKIQFKLKEISFMGHVITSEGVCPDPGKVRAVLDMPLPIDKHGVQRFIGLVTYLGSFCPALSTAIRPLHDLTKPDMQFIWSSVHDDSFKKAKALIASAPCLAYFNVNNDVTLQVDASETGLGGALLQPDEQGKLQPVAFTSSTLRPNEVAWAQIEKETLAICAACEKWDLWLYGKKVTIHTDHQPLETIFKRPLAKAPRRLQKLMLRLQRYSINVVYKKGTSLVLADTLSRAPLPNTDGHKPTNFELFRLEVEHFGSQQNIQLTSQTTRELQRATSNDSTMQELMRIVSTGWPKEKSLLPSHLSPYWCFRDLMSVSNGIVYRGLQAVVPAALHNAMLKKVHTSHLSADSNIRMCKDVIFWPGMQAAVRDMCDNCGQCAQFSPENPREPMQSQPVPEYPWQFVSQDLCQFEDAHYLVTVDHFSDFIELDELDNTLSTTVIDKSKAHFSRHGIPEVLLTDNGPQFVSVDFASFCTLYGITHITSSPYWPRGNGKAESAVKVVKSLMKKCTDIHLAILHYRNTPQQGHTYSPAQRSLGRRTRSTLPMATQLLMPEGLSSDLVQSQISSKRHKAKVHFDKRAQTRNNDDINIGDFVYMKPPPRARGKPWQYGKVVSNPAPRSYEVEGSVGISRRNRAHVRLAAPPPVGSVGYKKWASSSPTSVTMTSNIIQTKNPANNEQNQMHCEFEDETCVTGPAACVKPPIEHASSNTDASIPMPAGPPDSAQVSKGSLLVQSPYTTRAGRVVKPPRVFDPSD